jgi:RNA polymerase sigma factor (sigma-70 family)
MPGGFSQPASGAGALGGLLRGGLSRGAIPAAAVDLVLTSENVEVSDLDLFLQLTEDLKVPIVETRPRPVEKSVKSPVEKPLEKPFAEFGAREGLALYFRALGAYPLLTAEKERLLMRRARRGDRIARDEMIRCNLRLVVYLARRYKERGVAFEDLIEEGNLGLLEAIQRFDPERGFRFSTYATWWIRHGLGQSIAHFSRTVRLPLDFLRRLHQLLEAERFLTQKLGRFPREEDLAKRLGLSLAGVRRLASMREGSLSLDGAPSGSGDGPHALRPLRSSEDIESIVEGHLQKARIDAWLRALPATEELVLRARFGFLDGRPRSLAEVGRDVGKSRERIRQIELRAIGLLKSWVLAPSGGLGNHALHTGRADEPLASAPAPS